MSMKRPDHVLPGGDGADGAGEDVIEHQGADGELGQPPADGVLDHAVDAAAREHGAAFDVDGPDGIAEEHDAEDEPRRGLADGLLADAADVIGGAGQVAQDDGGGPPEADERQGNAADDQDVDGTSGAGFGKLGNVKAVGGRRNLSHGETYSVGAPAVDHKMRANAAREIPGPRESSELVN